MSTPLINGINYAWGNISFILFSTPVIGIVSINYKEKQDKKNNYGAGTKPVSRAYGQFEYEGDIELYLDTWKGIINDSPLRNPLLIAPFDIPVTFSGNGVIVTKDVLRACEFMENPFTGKSGDTRLTVKISLIIGDIIR